MTDYVEEMSATDLKTVSDALLAYYHKLDKDQYQARRGHVAELNMRVQAMVAEIMDVPESGF